jgi:hypothetical protein
MTEQKPTRRDILKPLHLVGIALGCGVFAMLVTIFSTGGFTARVNSSIARGTYKDLPPFTLGLVIGGICFIVTLLIMALLMLAVNPSTVAKTIDRPILLDPKPTRAQRRAAKEAEAAAAEAAEGGTQPDAADAASAKPDAPEA